MALTHEQTIATIQTANPSDATKFRDGSGIWRTLVNTDIPGFPNDGTKIYYGDGSWQTAPSQVYSLLIDSGWASGLVGGPNPHLSPGTFDLEWGINPLHGYSKLIIDAWLCSAAAATTDTVMLTFDRTSSTDYSAYVVENGVAALDYVSGIAGMKIGPCPAANATANYTGAVYHIEIPFPSAGKGYPQAWWSGYSQFGNAVGDIVQVSGGGLWINGGNVTTVNSIQLSTLSGAAFSSSRVLLYGVNYTSSL